MEIRRRDLERVVRESNALRNKLDRRLQVTVPQLLNYIIELTKTRSSAKISSYHPTPPPRGSGKLFTEGYTVAGGNIYRVILDPTADVMDEGQSSMIKIPKEEFLRWAKETDVRTLDTYNRMIEYIQTTPSARKQDTKRLVDVASTYL